MENKLCAPSYLHYRQEPLPDLKKPTAEIQAILDKLDQIIKMLEEKKC
jgi:hypothetical protein